MKCAICLLKGLQETDPDKSMELLMNRDWPPAAITTIRGTAVCLQHIDAVP